MSEEAAGNASSLGGDDGVVHPQYPPPQQHPQHPPPLAGGSTATLDRGLEEAMDRLDSLVSFPHHDDDNDNGPPLYLETGRRRARTLDVEWGGTFSYDDDGDDDDHDDGENDGTFGWVEDDSAGRNESRSAPLLPTNTPTTARPQPSSLRALSPSQEHRATDDNAAHSHSNRSSPTANPSEDDPSDSLERRCRYALHQSRVLRGLLLLCIYGSLEIWPWTGGGEPLLIVDDAFPASSASGDDASIGVARQQQPPWRHDVDHNNATVRRTRGTLERTPDMDHPPTYKTTVPLSRLPHFSHPRAATGTRTTPSLARTTPHMKKSDGHPLTVTLTDEGTNRTSRHHYSRTNKIPPPLSGDNSKTATTTTLYRKKKARPILSYAHSYRLRQEALVFGHESNLQNFWSDSSDPDTNPDHRPLAAALDDTVVSWHRILIWVTLLVLVADTVYREYRHGSGRSRLAVASPEGTPVGSSSRWRRYYQYAVYRWGSYRPFRSSSPAVPYPTTTTLLASTPANPTSPGTVRHRRLRRSPSPGGTTMTTTRRGTVDPTTTTVGANTQSNTTTPSSERRRPAVRSSSWRPRRRFDSY